MNILDHAKMQLIIFKADLLSDKVSILINEEIPPFIADIEPARQKMLVAERNRLDGIIELIQKLEHCLIAGLYDEALPPLKSIIHIIKKLENGAAKSTRLKILEETELVLIRLAPSNEA